MMAGPSEDHEKETNSVNKMNEPRSGFSSEYPVRAKDRQKPWWQSCETLSRETSNTCQSQALWDSKRLLFEAAKFEVICYCDNKLTHHGNTFPGTLQEGGFKADSFWAQGKPALVWASWPVWGFLFPSFKIDNCFTFIRMDRDCHPWETSSYTT